ncbi:transglycosylase domain-containing protein [Calidithermus terrae]|nr:transglycosylase domain-containing protein [Calidithermus terrae]
MLAGLVGGLGAGGYLAYVLTRDLPSLEAFENLRLSAISVLYDRDGNAIATKASEEDGRAVSRTLIRLSDVSPAAVSAVVFSEDKRFFEHYGVDWIRLIGGLYYTFRGDLQGGSTITTQVVKNTLLRDIALERKGITGLERKLKEFPLAIELERRYSKQDILEVYFNVINWGGNATGIWAAANAYFGKDPSRLTLAEGAYLATLIPGPNSRYLDLEGSRARMKALLDAMVADNWISPAEAEAAWKEPLVPLGWQAKYDGKGNLLSAKLVDPEARKLEELQVQGEPYFVLAVQNYIRERLGNRIPLGEGGLKIYTTLDPRMQRIAERAVANGRYPVNAQAALAALNPETGEVYALVGARPGTPGEFNRATQTLRSPGSAIKPFVYGTAIEAGWTQTTTVLDAPVSFPDPSRPGGVWRPKNFSGTFLNASVTLRYALDMSLNIPAIRTAEAIGVQRVGEKLRAAGFCVGRVDPKTKRCNFEPNLSNAIGGGVGISPLGLAAAYAAFVNGGYRIEPVLVRRIENAQGKVLFEAKPERTLLFSPQVAYIVWDMLKGYVYDYDANTRPRGLAISARVPGRVVGGKTGTSNDEVDLWFAGASPGLVAALWVGRDDNKPQRWRDGSAPSSSFVNPPVWAAFMEEALRGRPAGDFPQPSGLVASRHDVFSGAPSERGKTLLFIGRGTRPQEQGQQGAQQAAFVVPNTSSGGTFSTSGQTIAIDAATNCLAAPDTPPERVRYLQVPPSRVSSYQCG